MSERSMETDLMTRTKSWLLLGTLIPAMALSHGTFAAPPLQLAQAPSADDDQPGPRRQRPSGEQRQAPGAPERPPARPAPGQSPAARPTAPAAPERPAASAPTAPRPPASAPQTAPAGRTAPAETAPPQRRAAPSTDTPAQTAPEGAPRIRTAPSGVPQRSAPTQAAPPSAPTAPTAPRTTQPAAPTVPQASPSAPAQQTAPARQAPQQPGVAQPGSNQPNASGARPNEGGTAPRRSGSQPVPGQTAPAQTAPSQTAPSRAAPGQAAPSGQPAAPTTGQPAGSPPQQRIAPTQAAPSQPSTAPTTGQPAGASPQPQAAPSQTAPAQPGAVPGQSRTPTQAPAQPGTAPAPGQAGQPQLAPGQPAASGQPAMPAPERQGRRGGIGLGGAAAIGLGAAAIGGIMATQGADRLDDVRRRRQETREGDVTIIREPGRTIIRGDDDRVIIRRDETQRFRDLGIDARSERRGEEIVTVYDRPDGTQIVTVTDADGRLLRRSRRQRDGGEIVIIDNVRRDGPQPRFAEEVVELPPPPLRIPRERYVVDAERADERLIYETITAPPVAPVPRRYTLDEVRYSPDLRAHMRSVDVDTINFDSGSWTVAPDQAQRLRVLGQAVLQAVQRTPNEVFLVEGHTDAVGSDIDNLSLSDRRAQSVAEILTRDFGVPAENLTTQGYGEQNLKVQTQDDARANRRVTLRRITPLLTGQNG